ncbi:MAG: fibronectin type III domain-containing protein, partial [Gammaproteobacteria bacterium]
MQVRALELNFARSGSAESRGPWSLASTFFIDAPPPPVDLQLNLADNGIRVAWSKQIITNAFATTGFLVRWRRIGGGPISTEPWTLPEHARAKSLSGADTNQYVIQGLASGDAYQVQVAANNVNGRSQWVEAAIGIPAVAAASDTPQQPRDLIITLDPANGEIAALGEINPECSGSSASRFASDAASKACVEHFSRGAVRITPSFGSATDYPSERTTLSILPVTPTVTFASAAVTFNNAAEQARYAKRRILDTGIGRPAGHLTLRGEQYAVFGKDYYLSGAQFVLLPNGTITPPFIEVRGVGERIKTDKTARFALYAASGDKKYNRNGGSDSAAEVSVLFKAEPPAVAQVELYLAPHNDRPIFGSVSHPQRGR